jgi:hypothetical protein
MPRQRVDLTTLDFETIKGNLKNFLRNQDEFTDFDFEGSGMNVLLDVLAYNSQNNAYLANMIANEMEIDSAILRMNVVSRAKLLGYTPRSKTAAKAIISLTVEDPTSTEKSLYLPRGTKFSAGSGSNQFVFRTLKDYNLDLVEEGVFRNNEIEIFEGAFKNHIWTKAEGTRFIIPSKNIDIDSLKVAVYENQSSYDFEVFTRAFGANKIDGESSVYWVYETDGERYEIKFGDGVFGKSIPNGAGVYIEYLEPSGVEANNITRFSLQGIFAGYENSEVIISTIINSFGAAERESTESIKKNATRFFSSQNRAVTKDDFKSLVSTIYPYAKSVSVWGGEELLPRQYGKVFVSIIPDNYTNLTKEVKREILRKMSEKMVVGIQPQIMDPSYIRINVDLSVDVRRSFVENVSGFSSNIRTIVVDLFEEKDGLFENDFHYSDLISVVKNSSRAIVATRADITMSIQKTITDTLFEFGNSIVPATVTSNKVSFFASTKFDQIKDNGKGELQWDGMKVGTVDYSTGKIEIDEVVTNSRRGGVEIFAEPLDESIYATNQRTLLFYQPRFKITVKAV